MTIHSEFMPEFTPDTIAAIQRHVVVTIQQGILLLDESPHLRFELWSDDAKVGGWLVLRTDWCKHPGARPGVMSVIDAIDIPALSYRNCAVASNEPWLGPVYKALKIRLSSERVVVGSSRGGWGFSSQNSRPA